MLAHRDAQTAGAGIAPLGRGPRSARAQAQHLGGVTVEWIEDEAPAAGEPRDPEVQLDERGLRVREETGHVHARWASVLGTMIIRSGGDERRTEDRSGDRLHVLVPRRPPRPPWVTISPRMLAERERAAGLAKLAQRIEERASQRGYREAAPQRPAIPPAVLLERVLAREEIPGAVEIPVGHGDLRSGFRRAFDGVVGFGGGSVGGLYGAAFLSIALQGSPGLMLAIMAGGVAAGGLGGAWLLARRPRRLKGRVMVLCPDGAVIGFSSGPRAMQWSELAPFEIEHGELGRSLVIRGQGGERLGALDSRWFDASLELVCAVAKAYRGRLETGSRAASA